VNPAQSSDTNTLFIRGLVFGFDVGTGSIGYAVRRGKDFLDVGVIICPADTNDLSKRRERRRQRRTLRSKKYRRQWLRQELEKLGLPAPKENLHDPVALRVKAVNGKNLTPEELHVAIAHLWKRRGYLTPVPWSNQEDRKAAKKPEEEWGSGTVPPDRVRSEFERSGYRYPCEFLDKHRQQQRRRVWPRDLLKAEFDAIVARYPMLAEKANRLLHGDLETVVKGEHVYFTATESRNPGVLGLRWPRFDNRGPGVDSLSPVDSQGRPLHVVKRAHPVFRSAQWELAIENFHVLNAKGEKVKPDAAALARLREIWLGNKKKAERAQILSGELPDEVRVSDKVLEAWAEEISGKYTLIEGQEALTSTTGQGRARYSTPTLSRIVAGETFDPPQPLLIRPGEGQEKAINRFLAEIKHPVVHHRLFLFKKLLSQLVETHGNPNLIVIEAVRSLAMGKKTRAEYLKELKTKRDDRNDAYVELKKERQSTSKQAILRYRLWKETDSFCPFCSQTIPQADLYNGNADIAHIVPRSLVECNEFCNLTIAHVKCNRMEMQNQIPRLAFPDRWPEIEANARRYFKRRDQQRKLQLFLCESNEEAEELIESKSSLVQTAYIAKMLRRLCLIELGWTGPDGRDPSDAKGNLPSRSFLVTNGAITSRFREAWGLDEILHPKARTYTDEEWATLSDEARAEHKAAVQARYAKNRGDHRHHALDAMVIACTLPWLAHRVVDIRNFQTGEPVWWQLDPSTRRLLAVHPLFANTGDFKLLVDGWMQRDIVRHHMSRSPHKAAYKTTYYSRRNPNVYLGREAINTLTPRNIGAIYPEALGLYIQAAWQLYAEEFERYCHAGLQEFAKEKPIDRMPPKGEQKQIEKEFAAKLCFAHFDDWRRHPNQPFTFPEIPQKPMDNLDLLSFQESPEGDIRMVGLGTNYIFEKLPADFTERLCFAHFQWWREKVLKDQKVADFSWPTKKQIPIRSVRFIEPVNDKSVFPDPSVQPTGLAGLRAFVKRTDLKEVRIQLSAKRDKYVPVFVPVWKQQPVFSSEAFDSTSNPLATIRKNQIVELKSDYSEKYRAGRYVVVKLGEKQLTLIPPHVVFDDDALQAHGLPKSGFQPYWPDFIHALGYELPHPSSAQSESAGAAEA
jgi:hypothetical protein